MSPYNIKVIILAGRGESTTLMVNALKDCFSIQMVVVESPVQKKLLIKQDIDTYDSIQTIIECESEIYGKFISSHLTNWIDPNNR